MLNPDSSSVDYGTMLKSPAGYTVDFAIGTTYSLDLRALMGSYLSLGLSVDTDSDLAKDPMYLFSALSEMKGKVLVFCEKGRIVGQGDYPALYCQLEGGIAEVDLPERADGPIVSKFPSFHPKTWIIRFTPTGWTGPARYRICILSRNLTFDSSWDLAASFDGEYREQHRFASEGGPSIRAYVRELRRLYGSGEFAGKLDTVIEEIAYVRFWGRERDYHLALPFSFVGVPHARDFEWEFNQALDRSSRTLIMTPFLSPASDDADPIARVAHHFSGQNAEPVLITRRESIAANASIVQKLSGFAVYAVRDDLMTAEFEQEENEPSTEIASPSPSVRDIHAKLYMFESTGEPNRCDVFIGSANATRKGLFANHEAMAHLVVKREGAFDSLLRELGLTPEEIQKGSLFEPVSTESILQLASPSNEEQSRLQQQQAFDRFLRKLTLSMRICRAESGDSFEVTVTAHGDTEPMANCRVSLATGGVALPLDQAAVFREVHIDKLTALVRITCKTSGFSSTRLMKCRLLEGREYLEQQRRELFKSVTKRRFAEYLEFRLSGNPELVASSASKMGYSGTEGRLHSAAGFNGVYESLLRSYVTKPEQTDALITECIGMLADEHTTEPDGDDSTEAILALLETVQKGARYALS